MRIGTWTALLVLSAGTASAFMAGPPRQGELGSGGGQRRLGCTTTASPV